MRTYFPLIGGRNGGLGTLANSRGDLREYGLNVAGKHRGHQKRSAKHTVTYGAITVYTT